VLTADDVSVGGYCLVNPASLLQVLLAVVYVTDFGRFMAWLWQCTSLALRYPRISVVCIALWERDLRWLIVAGV